MDGHKQEMQDLDFTAERVGDQIAFTISGDEIYTRAYLNMDKVIMLHAFISEELEEWLME